MTTCNKHKVILLSSETVYNSGIISLQNGGNIAKEIYTYGCLSCGYRREFVIDNTKKNK